MCHLQELFAKYKSKGLVVLGLNASDDKQIALQMLRENGATFPNLLDSSKPAVKVAYHDYQGKYGTVGVPLSYLIGRDGKVVDAWYGGAEMHSKAVATLKKAGGPLAEAIQQEWEATAQRSADAVTAAAQRLFQSLRTADYNHDWIGTGDWKHFPAKDVKYDANRDTLGWVRWVCRKFKVNPITDVRLGKIVAGQQGLPTIHYELHLKNGEILQGDLPFQADSRGKQWLGHEGLDWHLRGKK